MDQRLRTFIAVELNPAFRQELARVTEKIKESRADVKWVKADNTHITLKFLGSLLPKKIKAIIGILPEMYDGIQPFEIRLTALGVFPNSRRPKVIWAGIDDDSGRLAALAERTETSLCRLGFPKEHRAFSSHITLGRTRSFKNLNSLVQAMQETRPSAGIKQQVTSVTFFKSTLTPKGPIYEPLHTQPLTNK